MTDLVLAIAHHLAVFALVGVFVGEFVLLRPGIDLARLRQLRALDAADGLGVAGHVAPEDVARHLHEAERCWRAVVAELVKAQGAPLIDIPHPRPALR